MARTKKKKKRGRSNEQMHRSTPKHSSRDLLKAVGIAGLAISAVGALFFVQVESKPLVDYLLERVSSPAPEATKSSDETQMDRYTEDEAEGLDKLIKEKSK